MAPRTLLLAGFGILFLGGCQKAEIQTYRVAKDKTAAPSASPQLPADHPPVAQGSTMPPLPGIQNTQAQVELSWTPAPHWQTKALGQMRKGSYAIKGENNTEADLSVFVFPGAAGGLLENINRWRGQVALPPIDSATLAKEQSEVLSDTGLKLIVVDMTGSSGDRILGAVLEGPAESWFFKLKGPEALLTREKQAFISFLKSLKRN